MPQEINMEKILYYIEMGRIDPNKKITMRDMFLAGVFKRAKYGVKLLARVIYI